MIAAEVLGPDRRVGKAGLECTGTATIDVKKEWPTWRPTDEMIERSPRTYAKFTPNTYVQPGGPDDPFGARTLYLFRDGVDTYCRIHGPIAPKCNGPSLSSGCFRMLNEPVKDLYERVPGGAISTVLWLVRSRFSGDMKSSNVIRILSNGRRETQGVALVSKWPDSSMPGCCQLCGKECYCRDYRAKDRSKAPNNALFWRSAKTQNSCF